MRYNVITSILLSLLCIHAMAVITEEDPCDEYAHIKMSVSILGTELQYDISNNGTEVVPYVDSVWITNGNDTTQIIWTGNTQSGEPIDISHFERGLYVIWIQIGDCVMGRQFISRGYYTDVNNPKDTIFASKILRDGQWFILSGDHTYTPSGQQVE